MEVLGVEPRTSCTLSMRSTTELYPPYLERSVIWAVSILPLNLSQSKTFLLSFP